MEEENVCSSLPDVKDSVLQQPQQDAWTSTEHQGINGEQQATVWDETDIQMNQAHETDQPSPPTKAGGDSSEEAEQWERVIWPVRPMSCTSPLISFATVQWDMPDPAPETPSLMTDSSVANQVISVDTTSPSLHQPQDTDTEFLTQEVTEEEDGSDLQPLKSNLEGTGSSFEVCT